MDFYAVVHNDFDGTASAAVYSRAVGNLPRYTFFTEPTKLHLMLDKIEPRGVNSLMIADLGPNANTLDSVIVSLKKLLASGVKVQWFDHHVWKDEWKKKVTDAGVELYHDTSTCGAGVVSKIMNPGDEVGRRLASADCAVDIWTHDDPLGEKLRRIVENRREFEWKLKVMKDFFEGRLWSEEYQEILLQTLKGELEGFTRLRRFYRVLTVDDTKVAIAIRWKGPPDISYAAQYIMARSGAKVFVSANGFSISFRSREINVRDYAVAFGGGGHPLAAGASFKIPALYRFLKRIGFRGPALGYVSRRVTEVIKSKEVRTMESKERV